MAGGWWWTSTSSGRRSGDDAFRSLAQDGLKTYRKQNAFMVFGTQSPADVLRSEISHTILEQCATKVFLPNPHAQARDYIDGFGLTEPGVSLVREDLAPERPPVPRQAGPELGCG